MDPNANLRELLALADKIRTGLAESANMLQADMYRDDTERLCELVEALDSWMRMGGFPPEAWKVQRQICTNTILWGKRE